MDFCLFNREWSYNYNLQVLFKWNGNVMNTTCFNNFKTYANAVKNTPLITLYSKFYEKQQI